MESGEITDDQISASSQFSYLYLHAAHHSRLHSQHNGTKAGGWSAATNNGRQWLQVDLGCYDNRVTRIATQGRHSYQQWVTKYKLQYSYDAMTFWYYKEQGMTTDKVKIAQLLSVQHMCCFVTRA